PLSATPIKMRPPPLLEQAANSAARLSRRDIARLNWCLLSPPLMRVRCSCCASITLPPCSRQHHIPAAAHPPPRIHHQLRVVHQRIVIKCIVVGGDDDTVVVADGVCRERY